MNFEQYRPLALRTAKVLPTKRENIRHAILGLITELGEFTTNVKRIVVYGKPMDEAMRLNMIEESGDALWYVPLAMEHLQVPELSQEVIYGVPKDLADAVVFLGGAIGALCAWYSATNQGWDAMDDDLSIALSVIVYVIDTVIAPAICSTGDQVRAENIAKLRLRFPDAYSDVAAEARADKGGLPALLS